MNRYELIQTNDQSFTVKDLIFNETFHSIAGARSESLHVFINNGLHHVSNISSLSLFEMGFGSGLNVLLTMLEKPKHQTIYYETIDLYPLPFTIVNTIVTWLSSDYEKELLKKIWLCKWNEPCQLSADFVLNKKIADIRKYTFENQFHLVYYDAFSYKSQPDLWSADIFSKIYQAMLPESCLVTYACNGTLKKNLRQVGFIIERLRGLPPKHHMIRALKKKNLSD